MKCPFCGFLESKVLETRTLDEGARIRRRRECLGCSKRFNSYESIELLPIIVIKKDKTREPFDRNKLLNGIVRACEKRPVSLETVQKIVDEYLKHEYFVFQKCDSSLGNSNCVILIEKKGVNAEGVILMDTHDRVYYKENDCGIRGRKS